MLTASTIDEDPLIAGCFCWRRNKPKTGRAWTAVQNLLYQNNQQSVPSVEGVASGILTRGVIPDDPNEVSRSLHELRKGTLVGERRPMHEA